MSAASSQTSPQVQSSSSSSSGTPSPSNSISLVRLDELSSFGATKRSRLPALIKLNPLAEQQQQQHQHQHQQQQHQQQEAATSNSMPDFSGSQMEKMATSTQDKQADSLPADLPRNQTPADKENANVALASLTDDSHDFQVVDMDEEEEQQQQHREGGNTPGQAHRAGSSADLMGPSLPAPKEATTHAGADNGRPADGTGNGAANGAANKASCPATSLLQNLDAKSLSAQLQSTNLTGQYASHLGDSLIEMIINLRNENQNLIRALETNNDYVKERLSEFKRCQEEAKRRESQHAMEKAEFEHQARKLRRQNGLLSDRLKSLEAKLKDMNVEVSESLQAARSSKASSIRDDEQQRDGDLYPQLALADDSFRNSALDSQQQQQQQQPATMQMDATSGELYNQDDEQQTREQPDEAARLGAMSKEELGARFDANKAQFYALDDPLKQCDQLEQQLNDIGRRDFEICLLQQQLNIYRQDFRLERMAKLEAKIQIERLKNDIDRLCLERVQERSREREPATSPPGQAKGVHFRAAGGEGNLISQLGCHLSKKAMRSATKAAKYAAKQAHLEEKAAAALARAAAAKAAASSHFGTSKAGAEAAQQPAAEAQQSAAEQPAGQNQPFSHHGRGHHGRGHRHSAHFAAPGAGAPARAHHRASGRGGLRSEVMNDLLSTANKAMLTGYKMASTHVNLALDKLSQYEQQQASQLDPSNKPPIQEPAQQAARLASGPSAPPMEPPSID